MADTPNTIPTKTVWSKVFQLNHYKVPVYPILASEDLRNELEDGATIKRTYNTPGSSGKMAGDGGYVTRPYVNVEESLVIDQKDYYAVQFPSWEKLLWVMNNDRQFAEVSTRVLHNQTDANILAAVQAGAAADLDANDLDGSTTDNYGLVASVSNILEVFTKANEILRLNNVEYPANIPYTGDVKVDKRRKMKVAVIPPHVANYLEQYTSGKNSSLGDKISENGYMQMFQGFNVFVSNNLPFTAVLQMATNPTDGDTVVIGGVTLTYRSTQGALAGSLNIGGSAATSVDILVDAINNPFTTVAEATDAGHNALTATEINTTAKELIWGRPADNTGTASVQGNISAEDGTTFVTITVRGVNKIAVSETLTAAADIWTTALQISHGIFAVTKCIDLVMKRTPNIDTNPVSGKIAKDFVCWDLFGRKVYRDQSFMIVDAKFDVSSSAVTAPTQTM